MEYRAYKGSRDLSWKILLNENVRKLPVMVGQLCKNMGIKIRYYEPKDQNDGFSTVIDGTPVIFVSNSCNQGRQRFTAAHELGHILLGHVGHYVLVNREPSPKDNPIEQAANVFASRLLAPACVLWGCNVRSVEGIMALCQISYQAAKFRAARMGILYQRGMFLTSPAEREVYQQFLPFINEHNGIYL